MNYILATKEKGNSIRLVNKDDDKVVDDECLPDYINTFFTEIGPNLANNFTDDWVNNMPEYQGETLGNVQVNNQQIEKLIREIDTSKSSSIPHVSSNVMKDAFLVLIPQLVYMFNLSFNCFPD